MDAIFSKQTRKNSNILISFPDFRRKKKFGGEFGYRIRLRALRQTLYMHIIQKRARWRILGDTKYETECPSLALMTQTDRKEQLNKTLF